MQFRVEAPQPPTVEEKAQQAVKSFFKFTLVVIFVVPFIVAFANQIASSNQFLGYCTLISGLAFVFRRPLRALYRTFYPPHTETPEEPPLEPPQIAPNSAFLGVPVQSNDLAQPAQLDGLWLAPEVRVKHLYLIGKTRTGKTTLIKNLIIQDIEHGHGVGFIDPHGDAAEELLGTIPPERIHDVIYLDPSMENCPAFNVLRLPYAPYKLAEDIVSVFKMFFAASWGQRMEHLLRFSVLTLISDPEPRTIKDLRTLFLDEVFRADVVSRITDPTLQEFWQLEFPNMPRDAAAPIINKLSAFMLPNSPLARLFSRPENDVNLSAIMDEGKILIVNLAKGILGDEPSFLLGGLIAAGVQQAALARATTAPEQRRAFYFYVDEFQNYVVSSFETILSEAAKYKLFLTLAHQTLGQLPSALEHAIFGNVATIISFQVSAEDASRLQREMHRSRYVVRPKQSSQLVPFNEFITQQKQICTLALTDKWAGMPRADRQVLEGKAATSFSGAMNFRREVEARREKVRSVLATLERGEPDPKFLKEVFPDYEIRALSFPNVEDFTNLPPRHAFARIERAENVTFFRTVAAPEPNQEIRAAILETLQHRTPERSEARAADAPQQANGIAPPVTLHEEEPITKAAELDHVQEARERRANQQSQKKRNPPSKAPAPKSDEEFEF